MLSLALFLSFVLAPKPTAQDVMVMFTMIPEERTLISGNGAAAHFERSRDAKRIAEAISAGVQNEDDPWMRAAEGAVYAAYEAAVQACPKAGDGGKSFGTWQMQEVREDVACNPLRAFPVWLSRAKQSEVDCRNNPKDEKLAELASGSCFKAKKKVRLRRELAQLIVESFVQ